MKRILQIMAFANLLSFSNAQLTSINENFDSFIANSTPSFPQNGWTSKTPPGLENFMVNINEDGANKFVQGYAFTQVNVPHYLISPQIVAPDGTTTLTFEASKFIQSAFMGTIEAGLVADPTDMSTFTSLGAAITLQTTTPETFTYNVPASSYQYIAFKFVGLNAHASTKLDNIVYGVDPNLSVNDTYKKEIIGIYPNPTSDFVNIKSDKDIVKVMIFNQAGELLKTVNSKTIDLSDFPVGIYIFDIKLNDKNISSYKVKVIKK